jgi:hypothetical protein
MGISKLETKSANFVVFSVPNARLQPITAQFVVIARETLVFQTAPAILDIFKILSQIKYVKFVQNFAKPVKISVLIVLLVEHHLIDR